MPNVEYIFNIKPSIDKKLLLKLCGDIRINRLECDNAKCKSGNDMGCYGLRFNRIRIYIHATHAEAFGRGRPGIVLSTLQNFIEYLNDRISLYIPHMWNILISIVYPNIAYIILNKMIKIKINNLEMIKYIVHNIKFNNPVNFFKLEKICQNIFRYPHPFDDEAMFKLNEITTIIQTHDDRVVTIGTKSIEEFNRVVSLLENL